MKSLYRRQFAVMAAVILVAFLVLGFAFAGLSYQYFIRDKRESMQRNADYIAGFTTSYLTGSYGAGVEDRAYQLYISTLANISDCTVIVADTSGEIGFSSAGAGSFLNGVLPSECVKSILTRGEYSARSDLGGVLGSRSYVTGAPIYRGSYLTGTSYPVGVVLVVSGTASLTSMWQDLATIFVASAAVVLLLTSLVSSATSMWQTKPLKEMAQTVQRFGRGEFGARVEGCQGRRDEVGELAEAFNAMAESLATSEAQRSEFIANVSHELKTPMTTIAGFADGILDGTIPPEKEAEALATISSETRRLSRLVRRMLDVSRLQSEEGVSPQERFDVSELLLRVLVSLEGKITQRELDVSTDLPEGPVMVWGDPDGITQVCYNLLDNAIKFSTPGTTLDLEIHARGNKAYITVRNRGETIPPEELGHVFERFHKTDHSRSVDRDGVGLGLYIAKTIIYNHKENITVSSNEGVTEFTFTMTIA